MGIKQLKNPILLTTFYLPIGIRYGSWIIMVAGNQKSRWSLPYLLPCLPPQKESQIYKETLCDLTTKRPKGRGGGNIRQKGLKNENQKWEQGECGDR